MEKPVFDAEDKLVGRWLGIRNLQLEILYAIYCLELEEEETSHNNIRIKFNLLFNRDIARQNVFSQVKALIERGYLERKGKKELKTNFEAITSALNQKSRECAEEAEKINEYAVNLHNQFKKISKKEPKPETQYLGKTECLDILAEHIPHMKNIYIISPRFPNIAYNKEISKNLKRNNYHEALREHLKTRGNQLFYLTALNMETTYTRALQVTKNPTKAYKETCKMMDELCTIVAENPGLKVRYWEQAYLNHIFILENPTHGEVVMTIEENKAPTEIMTQPLNRDFPGIYIKSKEISDKAKDNFLTSWEQGVDLNSKKGQAIIQNIEQRLYAKINHQAPA